MKNYSKFTLIFLFILFIASCDFYEKVPEDADFYFSEVIENYEKQMQKEAENPPDFSAPMFIDEGYSVDELPDFVWYTSKPANFGSPQAKQGGTFYTHISDFPATFRYCGPNSDNVSKNLFWTQMPLLDVSLDDYSFMPSAATHWAFAKDNKTVYYSLNKNMLWSDGTKCTADDFVFAVNFFMSKNIVDPWMNDEYAKLKVKKINKYCIAVTYLPAKNFSQTELLNATNFRPVAKHFYKGIVPANWAVDYNRIPEPTTGPYALDKFDDTNGLIFKKVKNWWGHEYDHYKGMANYDQINYLIIVGNAQNAIKYLKTAQIDCVYLEDSNQWFKALEEDCVTQGFINIWSGHYQRLQGMKGFFFNVKKKPLNDIRIRKAVIHSLNLDGALNTAFGLNQKRLKNIGRGQIIAGISFNDNTIQPLEFDIEKANKLLNEAGYNRFDRNGIRINSEGKKLELEILFARKLPKDILGLFYSQAKLAGIELKFRYMRDGAIERVMNDKFQIWYGELMSNRIPNHYYDFHSKFADTEDLCNVFGLRNTELDELLEQYNNFTGSLSKQAELNKEIERAVNSLAVFIPAFYTDTQNLMAWKWVCFPGWLNRRHERFFSEPMFGYFWSDEAIYEDIKKARTEKKHIKMSIWNLSERNVLE
ncbi:MAG: ABC transporter substrate-binding protein [Treponema sp.]|nr:MAG: ABC transporter substrate-binding protein [Treponema sp.]